ncbi:glucosaminidase domain-containing protein [Mammaliicoccus sciuri]|uniref:glucosaminidase domain-containing protein n=1 Tax=Mammaliicoccus sciuri TaxID=1296 RepID=UPI0019D3A6CF|nr:glucosaminidase domain-containing protein [Mammaliicoccus sciuri]QSN66810.1 glucosaminidase domain-containing protein [Mammaliicoccus sciuri]UIU21529.1 glucosaminidase domain-containing protein [Mammaliicoccus sciuri]UIU24430.1 glucosaminidase domain-containing protein [Mammaliicoccus sciuri]
MDKKFYYKTPALVAMTLAGTTLVSHQVNAEEQTTNKENKNIIEQHDNASQIQDEQKELKSQSLNVSGTKEYKDPSIIDGPNQKVENTTNESVQPTSNEVEQDTDVTSAEDNTEVSEDTTQPTSNEENQNSDVASTDDNSEVTNNDEVSEDTTQPTSNEENQNSDVASSEDNSEVTNNDEVSEDTTQPTSNEENQNSDVASSEDNSEVTNNDEVSEDTTQPTSNEENQNSDVASTDDNSEVTNNDKVSEDTAQSTSNEEDQKTEVASSEDNSEVTNNNEVSEDTAQSTSNEEDQKTEVASSEDNSEVTNNNEVSEDTAQSTSNEEDQKTEVASSEDNTEVNNNQEVSEDTTQSTSNEVDQNTEAANSSQNAKVQLETASVQPQVSTFAFRSVSSAPVVKKAVSTTSSSYSPTVSSSINNQIRNNNYAVPTYVEDFSSHIPKIPYRNGVGKPEGIIAHETANPNSTIQGEIAYMKNNYESAFVHAFVDDNNIIEVAPTDYLAWGAGGVANERFIHVELVRVYGGDRFARSINNYADYIATNLSYYGLPFDSAENDGTGTLWSHDAVSKYLGGTDHSDPYGWFAENNYTFNELIDLVREKYLYKTGSVTQPTTPVVSKPKPTTPVVSKPKPKPTTPVVSKPKPTKPVVSKPKPSTPVVSKPKPSTPVVSKPKPTTPVASPAKTVVVNYKGKVNTNASGVYSSVYDTKTKSAANKVGKTFNIGKQSNYNNQIYYLLQDNNGTPLGWVKSSDIQLQNNTKATPKPAASNTAKPKATPKPVASNTAKPEATPKPVASNTAKPKATPKPVASNTVKPKATPKPVASNTVKPKATPKPVASNTAKPKATPKPVASNTVKPKATPKPVASNTTKTNAVAKTVRVNYLGKVNKNISGVYTSVYDQKTVPAINKAGKTFKIGKQSTYNNQTYYLLQDNNAIPLGWVNAKDIQLQKVTTQPKVVNKPTVAQPKKTNAIKSSAVNNQPIALKENYQNYLIFDNSGYFYSEPSVSKKTLLGSLQNYQYSYFKVISSQKVGNELWYKGLLNGKTVWINAKYLQLAAESTNVSTSPYTLDQAVDIQMALRNGSEPKKVLASGIRNATRAEVKDAMDTSKYVNDPIQKYQFLDLNKSQNISATKLNELLRGKGILENQGNAFSQAAKAVGINEIYLISHALLETGNGTSDLANGGSIDQNGNVDLNAQTKYYNMFGVGAIDKNALYGGIKYAQQAGWNTPEKAILGGAQFIANNYIKSGQNTLYKMRFNPQNPGVHQYATGIDFAKSNAKRISDFYQQIQTDGQYYDVDQYKA